MYERKHQRPLAAAHFARRLLGHLAWVCLLLGGSLGLGIWGYHRLEGLSGLDAFLNASMILTGMGPVNELHTTGGKFFAGCYAIFSGVVFLTMAAVLFAPVLHRFLHRMHLEIEPEDERSGHARWRGPHGQRDRPIAPNWRATGFRRPKNCFPAKYVRVAARQ